MAQKDVQYELAARMYAAGISYKLIGDHILKSPRTIERWAQEDEFRAMVAKFAQERISKFDEKIDKLIENAMIVLEEMLYSKDPRSKAIAVEKVISLLRIRNEYRVINNPESEKDADEFDVEDVEDKELDEIIESVEQYTGIKVRVPEYGNSSVEDSDSATKDTEVITSQEG